jgi:4-amino-4-deoxy-L-arabinose transferase-like glycosyltransferase
MLEELLSVDATEDESKEGNANELETKQPVFLPPVFLHTPMVHCVLVLRVTPLLLTFCVGITLLWMVPVFLVGIPFAMPGLETVRTFVETGLTSTGDGRLSTILFALFSPWIAWEDLSGWTALSAAAHAAALFPLFFFIARLFDRRTAWLSIVLLALLPIFWMEALTVTTYTFSFFFLFLTFLAFVELWPRSYLLALAVSGLLFGFTLACKDTFVIFLPWFALAYLWVQRERWRTALGEVLLFLALTFFGYTLPLVSNALQQPSWQEGVTELLPALERRLPGDGHFFPDKYTFDVWQEVFKEQFLEEYEQRSFFDRMAVQRDLLLFEVGEQPWTRWLGNGLWLFLEEIPTYFQMETMGGVILYLLIAPGIVVLYRRDRRLLFLFVGLVLSMEVLLRFGLHFQREHLVNVAWGFALLAALGMIGVAQRLSQPARRLTAQSLLLILLLVTVGHLVQVNRKQFARLYTRSSVPAALAAAELLQTIPEDALVAAPDPMGHEYGFLSRRRVLTFREPTVERLLGEGKLEEAFAQYGVTHILRYREELSERMVEAMPGLQVLPPEEPARTTPPVTPFVRFLLHLLR